jgi:hypothetical protein
MSYDYDASCQRAADSQGITKIVAELASQGIAATVCQTGGFIMVAHVDLGDGWYIWAIAENACLYHGENDSHAAVVADLPKESPAEVAAHVANFVRRWRDGIAKMRATRKRAESLRAALPNDYGGEFDNGGFLYYGAHYIEDFGDRYCVTIENHGMSGSLEDCESYLYGFWVRMFYE